MMASKGFKTTNLDNYAGFGEVGNGDTLIGILGHLDIVPCGEGWNTNPLQLTEKDGILYGRGTSDDKGPVVAAMYAIKILLDQNIELNKRIRLIVGSNEENGSACLDYYVSKEGHIDYGFTPDGSFPGIHGEKGHIGAILKGRTSKILDIKGGVAKNVVCTKVDAVIEKDSFNVKMLCDYLKHNKLSYIIDEQETVSIQVNGVSAHASTPDEGINAMSHLMLGLKLAGIKDEFVDGYTKLIGVETNGASFDVEASDKYGALTLNVGVVSYANQTISVTIDIRYPVTMHYQELIDRMINQVKSTDLELLEVNGSKPLFYEPEGELIQSLLKAYQKVTGDMESQPLVIGGGTYSQGINNCIAFGAAFPGADHHIHDANEFVSIDDLLLQTEIYVEALLNLLGL